MGKKKIRVLQGIRQGKVGGGESVLLSLAEQMDKDIFAPVVLSFTEGPMVEKLRAMDLPVHVIHTEKPFDISVWSKVRQLMADEQVDIVHAHGTRAASNMFYAAQKLKKPLIYTCHGWSFHPDQNALTKKIRIWGERFLTKKATVNICVSHANRNTGVELFGSRFDPIVIQNSIDSRRFNPRQTYSNIRKELGIDNSAILFSSIARFTWQKQPLVLIQAFADALKQRPDLRLLMVGEGEERDAAKTLIDRLGIANAVTMQAFRQDVPDLLASTDIFVLPSLWEGLPVALLEAMSMGKAIIASNVDGTAEILEHEKTGILIETGNLQEDLTAAMVRLADDEQLRQSLGSAAEQRIREHFNVGDMTRKNEEIYVELYRRFYRHSGQTTPEA